jgi:two-component system OmpR family sensor kinase
VLPVQHIPIPHVFGTKHGPYAPESASINVPALRSDDIHYRVHAVAVPGGTLVTAISLDPTDQTLASLTHVELFVSVGVMIALLLLALWVVRLGMRPLDDMTETAGAIAGGDLTRRIRRADDRSEVGRLGSALNGMLSQIEAAFRERTSSEARLRRFVADASHELRTPLTSIRGYAELLRKGAFDTEDDRRRAAERIEGEASRMGLLVDDLLLLARLDQGRPLELSPVDLCRVVADAVEATQVTDGHRPVTVETEGAVVVLGDAARLRQIVDNLLHNAVVHTPAATAVRVSVGREGPTAVVRVADDGPGLDSEQAARVFDRFYRGSEARTGEGTGLGLSIVAALAAAHGGRASVNAVPGAGAVFTVEIPAAEPDVPTDRTKQATAPGTPAPGEGGPEGDREVPSATGGGGDERLAPSVRR